LEELGLTLGHGFVGGSILLATDQAVKQKQVKCIIISLSAHAYTVIVEFNLVFVWFLSAIPFWFICLSIWVGRQSYFWLLLPFRGETFWLRWLFIACLGRWVAIAAFVGKARCSMDAPEVNLSSRIWINLCGRLRPNRWICQSEV